MKKPKRMPRSERWRLKQAEQAEKDRMIAAIEKHLAKHQLDRFKLIVDSEAIERHGEHWYVVVVPDKADVSSAVYQGRLMRAENEIEQHEGLKVMLVSMLPQDDELEYDMPMLWAVRQSCKE